MRPGDLQVSLVGTVRRDRNRTSASESSAASIPAVFSPRAAELPTILLRWLPVGRSASWWITSGTVSG